MPGPPRPRQPRPARPGGPGHDVRVIRLAVAYTLAAIVLAAATSLGLASTPGPQVAGGQPPSAGPPAHDQAAPHRPPLLDQAAALRDGADRATVPGPSPTSARIGDLESTRGPAPATLRIPALEIDAPVVPVGQRDGDLDVPDDVVNVAWYEHGPSPGDEAGSAVLAAHVDLAGSGPGVFFRLGEVRPGDVVEVDRVDGSIASFVVERVERHPKAELPVDDLFARDGDPRIALITCGGAFDPSTRSYTDNVVAVAVPLG